MRVFVKDSRYVQQDQTEPQGRRRLKLTVAHALLALACWAVVDAKKQAVREHTTCIREHTPGRFTRED